MSEFQRSFLFISLSLNFYFYWSETLNIIKMQTNRKNSITFNPRLLGIVGFVVSRPRFPYITNNDSRVSLHSNHLGSSIVFGIKRF